MSRRPRASVERRSLKPKREPYPRVLLICEGSKSEPLYLEDLKRDLRISSANIQIIGAGASPSSLVDSALQRVDEDGDFDYAFCVFDRDIHADYEAARERCRNLRRSNQAGELVSFCAITSNPSFEYWLLLHFRDTDRPYLASGGKSAGAKVLSDLKREYPGYGKSNSGVYPFLKDRLDLAKARAARINRVGNENPHTRIVDLVEWLQLIRAGGAADSRLVAGNKQPA